MVIVEPMLRHAIKYDELDDLDNHEKNFVGALICTVMTMNSAKNR